MAFIVEMVRGKPSAPEFENFSCSAWQWKELLSISRTFGWNPSGTIYDTDAICDADYIETFEPSYEPDEWRFAKGISDIDALGLANGLRLALEYINEGKVAVLGKQKPSLLVEDMSAGLMLHINQPSNKLLASFAQFAERGKFAFAWDD